MAAEEAAVWPNSRRLPGIDRLRRERVQFTDLYCRPDVDKQPQDANITKVLLVLWTSATMHDHKLTLTPVLITLIHLVKGPEKEFRNSEGDYSNYLSNSSNQVHSKA